VKYLETKIYSKPTKKAIFKNKNKYKNVFLIFVMVVILSLFLSIKITTKSLVLDEQKVYGVTIGSYTTENTAYHYATLCRNRGGAGGVYQDGKEYLLFVSIYILSSDANTVSNNLIESGERASVYEWTLPKTKITFPHGAKNMIMVKEITQVLWTTLYDMVTLVLDFDRETKNTGDVVEQLALMSENTDEAIETALKLKGDQNDEIMQKILDSLVHQKMILNQLNKSTVKSSELKIAYFDLLLLNLAFRQKVVS